MDVQEHQWKFFRAGGVDQVWFRSGNDIAYLETLDQKLWLALACPAYGLEFDSQTLALLDIDHDGRIRAPEILAACKWLKEALRNLDDLYKGGTEVPLSSINDQTAVGAALLSGVRRILADNGRPGDPVITVADVADSERRFAATRFNGDGVVPAESASDPATRQVIEDILGTLGSVPDRSGKPGVNQEKTDAFFAEARLYAQWFSKPESDPELAPLGAQTESAAAAVAAVKAKVDDYFTRCHLAAFDHRAAPLLNGPESEYQTLATKELTDREQDIARLPLAHIAAGQALPLTTGVNPAWVAALSALQAALQALLGTPLRELTESDWNTAKTKLAAYDAWSATKPSTAVATLGPQRIRALLASGAEAAVCELIAQDAAQATEYDQLAAVQKLVLLQRDFVTLLNNFVNFSAFYSKRGAVFQVGTLYLDSRSCDLCVRVENAAKHVALAGLSKSYLAYCDCARPGGEKLAIAAAFTGGDSDNLMVGRNGLFYDREGRDWDATITKVIENPISVRQAFWAPYKFFVRLIEAQLAKRAAAADAASPTKLTGAVAAPALAPAATVPTIAPTIAPAEAAPAPAPAKKVDIGTLAAIGVAVAGLATFMTSVLAIFFGLGAWMPLGLVALVLAISGPSMLIAWLKLRQRNLGPILDANGWAINGRVKINVPFGGALTVESTLPHGAVRTFSDPYAERQRPWRFYVAVLVVVTLGVLWYLGKLDRYLPTQAKSTAVLGSYAPT